MGLFLKKLKFLTTSTDSINMNKPMATPNSMGWGGGSLNICLQTITAVYSTFTKMTLPMEKFYLEFIIMHYSINCSAA